MLPSLLYCEPGAKAPAASSNAADLIADLGAEAIIDAMSGGDIRRSEAAKKLIFESPAVSAGDISYRQDAVRDALGNREAALSLYGALRAGLTAYDEACLKNQPGYARFSPVAERLRTTARTAAALLELIRVVKIKLTGARFVSEAFREYIKSFSDFYDDGFLTDALTRCGALSQITEGTGVTLGATVGNGLKGTDYLLHAIGGSVEKPRRRAAITLDSAAHTQKAMELRDAALSKALSLIHAVREQMAKDLRALEFALAFYTGCILLHEKCLAAGGDLCFPAPRADETECALSFTALMDVGLLLREGRPPVSNSLSLDGKRLIVITGANQGGKSTFLRSVGCAQLMMGCGMFVAATDFRSGMCPGVFTHFCRPEDAGMDSGKLDEELRRLDGTLRALRPGAMLLMNESFSSTTEREGAAAAQEITVALSRAGVRVLFVTHLYDYARRIQELSADDTVLLRAQRLEDGARTYAVLPGLSLPTSHGMDLFTRIISSGGTHDTI